MMEMEDIGEDPDTSYRLMLTAAYYEPVITAENRCTVSMELHLVAQAICSRVESCETVTDMYSNKCDCSFETDNCDTYLVLRRQTLRTTVREVIKTPVPPAELLYMRAQVSSISGTTARITIVGLYTDEEGNCRALKGSLTAEFETELDENMSLIADCAYVTEVFASPTDEGVELKIPVEMEAVIIKKQTLCIPMQPELCEKQDTCDAPSLVLIPASACTDLWQVAKKYASTPELISKANSCQEEGAEAAMLLIPREP